MKNYFVNLVGLLLFVVGEGAAQSFDTCNNFGHFDLFLEVDPPATDGGAFLIDVAGDFPRQAGTNTVIAPADFSDFQGGIHKTDDPGWVVPPGNMLSASDLVDRDIGEILWFRALGSLMFWDRVQKRWLNPPMGERVRYFGDIPNDVVINGTPEDNEFYELGTIWSSTGVEGPVEAPLEEYVNGIHAHFDFCVEDSTGDCSQPGSTATGSPSVGAYLIELQLFSKELATDDMRLKYIDSPPVKMILNNGLVASECSEAIEALVIADTIVDDSAALPAAGILIMSGP